MSSSISLLITGLASPPITLLLGGPGTEGTGGTGLERRSELILLGKGFGGLSGASTASVNAKHRQDFIRNTDKKLKVSNEFHFRFQLWFEKNIPKKSLNISPSISSWPTTPSVQVTEHHVQ